MSDSYGDGPLLNPDAKQAVKVMLDVFSATSEKMGDIPECPEWWDNIAYYPHQEERFIPSYVELYEIFKDETAKVQISLLTYNDCIKQSVSFESKHIPSEEIPNIVSKHYFLGEATAAMTDALKAMTDYFNLAHARAASNA